MSNAGYQLYLRSREWRAFRKRYREECEWRCGCGSTERLELHHLTYENFRAERFEDVAPLCRACHFLIHSPDVGTRREREKRNLQGHARIRELAQQEKRQEGMEDRDAILSALGWDA